MNGEEFVFFIARRSENEATVPECEEADEGGKEARRRRKKKKKTLQKPKD